MAPELAPHPERSAQKGWCTAVTDRRTVLRTHIQIVGILHVVYNGLAVLTGVGFIVFWVLFSGAVGAGAAGSGEVPPVGGVALGGFLAAFGLLVGCLSLIPSLPGFLGGIACMRHRPWSRLVLIVVSALHIITFVPTSVLLGAYSLWVLLHPETKAVMEGYDWIPKD